MSPKYDLRMKQLTKNDKKRIARRVLKRGHSVADLAKEYGRSRSTIYNVVKGYTKTGSSSRKVKFTNNTKESILDMVERDPMITSTGIRIALDKDISISTINKYLSECGFVVGDSTKRPNRKR